MLRPRTWDDGRTSRSRRTGLTIPFRTGTTHRKYHGEECGDPHDSDAAIRWGLLYNLYADRLLGFNMFPQSVYETRESAPSCIVQSRVNSTEPVQRQRQNGVQVTSTISEFRWIAGKEPSQNPNVLPQG